MPLPLFGVVQAPRIPDFHSVMRDVVGVVTSVMCRFHISDDSAAASAGWNHRQRWQDSLKHGGNVSRLAMLPDNIKRELWFRLRPLFAIAASEADNPELEQRIAELEAERDREAKEREALQKRFAELEELVRRRLTPASPQQPHEERKSA